MSPQELEEQRLLLEALAKIPSTRVLVLIAAGFSGIFSSAWWIGLDSAPDRWTGTDQRTYMERHAKQHERNENSSIIKSGDIENLASEQERRIDQHVRIQEHVGADRRMIEHDRRLDEQAKLCKAATDEIFNHTRGTEARVYRIKLLEEKVEDLEKRLGKIRP